MMRRQFIRQFVLLLVVIGLVVGPFTAAASANAMAHEAMSAMADDMPCKSLDEAKAPGCQAPCPLMVVCMANGPPGGAYLGAVPFGLDSVVGWPASNTLPPPLGAKPPARPPRA